VGLAATSFAGIHHVVNAGVTSRAGWAREVLSALSIDIDVEEVGLAEFERPSKPPMWGVLQATDLPGGSLRAWQAAMADRVAELRESLA
jgi:dTDP-4-dehydrorhamnose reductase